MPKNRLVGDIVEDIAKMVGEQADHIGRLAAVCDGMAKEMVRFQEKIDKLNLQQMALSTRLRRLEVPGSDKRDSDSTH